MKRKVYMSVPMTIPMSWVQLFANRFPTEEFEVKFWDRITFHQEYYHNAKEVVFILPDGAFSYNVENLPVGVKRELKNSLRDGKKIYLAYITANGDYNIYDAEINGLVFTGIKGTSNSIFNNTVADKAPHYDRREDTSGSKIEAQSVGRVNLQGPVNEESDRRLLLMIV